MSALQVEAVRRALLKDEACGDQFDYWQSGEAWLLCMVDGLGHGIHAQTAALAALAYVGSHLEAGLEELFAGCDKALRGTRGAAMSLMRLQAGSLSYAGIGNTQARLHRRGSAGPVNHRLLGNYGIVGGGFRRLQIQQLELRDGDLLVLHTDGVSDKFDLGALEAGLLANPAQLAAHLLGEFGKALDDAAVMVARYGPPGQQPV